MFGHCDNPTKIGGFARDEIEERLDLPALRASLERAILARLSGAADP